jgi:hypothetical protein
MLMVILPFFFFILNLGTNPVTDGSYSLADCDMTKGFCDNLLRTGQWPLSCFDASAAKNVEL